MLPYFNLNIQMLAARQQAALAAAQLSPNRFQSHSDHEDMEDDEPRSELELDHPLDITIPESPSSSVPTNNKIDELIDKPLDAFPSKPVVCEKQSQTDLPAVNADGIGPPKMYDCKFCGISFQDDVLHTIHMGYHGYNDVFTCNMCGEKCTDRISFFLHIAKNQHS